MMVAPARAARRSSSASASGRTSQAMISPWFSIAAASASDLPPAPAARSSTRMPGLRFAQRHRFLRGVVLNLEGARVRKADGR